jgi:hypothetical protein
VDRQQQQQQQQTEKKTGKKASHVKCVYLCGKKWRCHCHLVAFKNPYYVKYLNGKKKVVYAFVPIFPRWRYVYSSFFSPSHCVQFLLFIFCEQQSTNNMNDSEKDAAF